MKKKQVTLLLPIAAGITLGYPFFLSWLFGFLASKQLAGKSAGERGKVKSIIIPFRGWEIRLHHWLYFLGLIGFTSATGIAFLTPTVTAVTYGLLGGVVFQGVYCYSDWHVVLRRRRRNKSESPLKPDGEPGERVLPATLALAALEEQSPSQKYSP